MGGRSATTAILGLTLAVALPGGSARAAEVLRVAPGQVRVEPGPAIEWLEDPTAALTIDDVTGPAQHRFRPLADDALEAGYSSSAYWLRLELDLGADGANWLLEIDYTQLDEVTLYAGPPGRAPRVIRTGDGARFDSRDLAVPTFAFRLPAALGPRLQLHLRVRSSGAVLVPLSLWRQDAFIAESSRRGLGWGIYYGFLLALALYNLCVWLVVRDRSYLYYVGYLISLAGFQASMSGHAFQYLWPGLPALATVAVGIFLALCVSLAVLFIRDMAAVAVIAPRLHRPMTVAALALLATIPALWLDYSIAIRALTGMAVVAVALLPVPIVLSYRRGYRPARYLALAIAMILPAGVLLALRSLGLASHGILTEHALQLATAAEALLLSFALADRITLLRAVALEAQRDLSRKLIAAQDAERKRIAGELHDGLGQNVMVLANGLTRMVRSGSDAAELADLAKQAAAEVRAVAHDLHPGALDRLGLAAALESRVEQALAAAGIGGECSVAPGVEPVLGPPAQLHVYRIVQESVANAIKHARASEITVRVRRADDRIEVRVEDDGVGLAASAPAGLGLAGIEERARLLGGTARVVSGAGVGVRVEVDLPVGGRDA
jgi:signal transduction histidine kinase